MLNLGLNRAVLALQSRPSVNGEKFQEMVRGRLRDRTPNLTTLANFLKTSPSTIQKKFRESGTALCLDFLQEVSAFYQMSVSEMCALPGSTWQEVKPLEAQLLDQFRDMTELERNGLLTVLQSRQTRLTEKRSAKLGRAELSTKEQELIDLFQRVQKDGVREGVLRMLRGAAEDTATDHPKARTTG